MDAEPVLALVTRALARRRLDAVLIGSAAAALQGAPVTTLAFDFMFRKTPRNLQKLRGLADDLGAVVLRAYYPVSELYRVMRDLNNLQLDFMARVDGVSSFEALRARATAAAFGGALASRSRVRLEGAMYSHVVGGERHRFADLRTLLARRGGALRGRPRRRGRALRHRTTGCTSGRSGHA